MVGIICFYDCIIAVVGIRYRPGERPPFGIIINKTLLGKAIAVLNNHI